MVTVTGPEFRWLNPWLAEQGRPLLQELEPVMQAKVLSALAGLIILGFAMVLLAWLGGRVTRRYMQRRAISKPRGRWGGLSEEDWASKPLTRRSPGPSTGKRETDT